MNFIIRNYQSNDNAQIKANNFYFGLLYENHKDFRPENIFCAVHDGKVLGVAHLEYDNPFFNIEKLTNPELEYKLKLEMAICGETVNPEEVSKALLDAVIARAKEIKGDYPDKKILLIRYFFSNDVRGAELYLRNGFSFDKNILVMEKDLTNDLPTYPPSENLSIIRRTLNNNAEKMELLASEAEAHEGVTQGMNNLNWICYAPDFTVFSAYASNRLIGNMMIWKFTPDHYATENIFVVPEFRNKGVAHQMICSSFAYLKSIGVSQASLSCYATNIRAINLYLSHGYELTDVIYEISLKI
jgi:GNAT superfamily N-acetyltransferase